MVAMQNSNAGRRYHVDLELLEISVVLSQPLFYPPDMGNYHSAKDWRRAGAKRITYSTTDVFGNVQSAVLYLGYDLCGCDESGLDLDMYAYADWLTRRPPNVLCGDTLQSHVRSQKDDTTAIEQTDYLIGNYLAGNDCDVWKEENGSEVCVFDGAGSSWHRASGLAYVGGGCLLSFAGVDHAAFLDISDSDENTDKTTKNEGFKVKWNLMDPPVPNGKKSAVNIAQLYDPDTDILAVRQHYTLGHNSRGNCTKTFGFSIDPQSGDSTTLDVSPWQWDYFGLENLVLPESMIPTSSSAATQSRNMIPPFMIPVTVFFGGLDLRRRRFAAKGITVGEKYRRNLR